LLGSLKASLKRFVLKILNMYFLKLPNVIQKTGQMLFLKIRFIFFAQRNIVPMLEN